jgi:hypothetical protein
MKWRTIGDHALVSILITFGVIYLSPDILFQSHYLTPEILVTVFF